MSRTTLMLFLVATFALTTRATAQEVGAGADPELSSAPVTTTAASTVVAPPFRADAAREFPLLHGPLDEGVEPQTDGLPMAPPSSRNTAMMVVGGAALVVGAIIGGDVGTLFMVGGGVIGLVGLWRYLQ